MKERKISFKKAALIYGAVLLTLILIGLAVLALFLADYERTRPNTVAARYVQSIDADNIRTLAKDTVDSLNHSLMSEDDSYDYILKAVNGAETARSSAESDGTSAVYYVRSGGVTLGKLVEEAGEESPFGFTTYSVQSAEFDFSPLCGEKSVSVPKDWTVSCSGELIVTDTEKHYTVLEEFYDDEALSLPYLTTYSTGQYLVEPELTISGDGEEFSEQPDESRFTDNCSEETKEALSEFCESFVRAYIKYSSNADKNTSGNYYRLAELIVPQSTLQKRMRYAVAGLGFASSKGDSLKDIEYKNYMDIGDGSYLCDLTYTVDTTGSNGVVTTENNLKLIIVSSDDGYLAQAMSSY